MTDRDDLLEGRVRAAFLSETRRAEADVEAGALAPQPTSRQAGRRTRARALAGLATLAIVALVAAGTAATLGLVRYGPATSSASPTSSGPTASQTLRPTNLADRYYDGIPRTYQGQPVLRWDQALAKRDTTKDATPFLVGVWLNRPIGMFNCPKDGCHFRYVSADAGGPATEDTVVTFRFNKTIFSTGPAIMRVDIHDPRMTGCPSQKVCNETIVVDDILWTGDAYTDPQPFSSADVVAALRSIDPPIELVTEDDGNAGFSGGGGPIDSTGLVPASFAETRPADMQIAGVFLMPSVEAMQRALPNVTPGPAGALQSPALRDSGSGWGPGFSYSIEDRWLIVDNVAFSVRTASPPTAGDEAWLARLEAALRATH